MDTLMPRCPFVRFLNGFGESPGTSFGHMFLSFSVVWGGKLGDSFKVHVFGDPGMEIMPECNDGMCQIRYAIKVF